jgi:serine protease Do/serine protease DegQ
MNLSRRSVRGAPIFFMMLVVSLWSSLAAAQLPSIVGETPVPSLAPMIKKVSPAVVNIATKGTVRAPRNPLLEDPFFRRFFDLPQGPIERQFQSAGSGVIIDAEKGYIITNAHVIENASEITVTLIDNRSFKADVVGKDEGSDVAVLKVKASGLTAIPLGDSSRAEVGDFVVAIGNPFGLQHTVTFGIISALGRSGINPEGYENFIQTDASINPGNSGGALVNLKGELIGINTAILSRSGGNIGIGFAIPSDMVRSVTEQLIKYGEVRRGLLGVSIQTLTPDVAENLGLKDTTGALVSEVMQGSAAEKAGVRPGDIITSVNGQPVKSSVELRNAIGLLRVGDTVELGVIRDGKPRRITARIGERDDKRAAALESDRSRAPQEIHPGLAGAKLRATPNDDGVLVQDVAPGSPAAQNNLRPNDVIVAVGRKKIKNLDQLRAAVKDAQVFVLTIRRNGSTVVLPIRSN